MTDIEHLSILQQGSTVWNKWREDNPEVMPYFREANLGGSDLRRVNFSKADLEKANLTNTYLVGADFTEANLDHVILTGAIAGNCKFDNVDLRLVVGLDSVTHDSPSYIDIHTLYKSQGEIPSVFLRGAGVPDEFITFVKSLVGPVVDYYSAFISYSSKDEEFARRLYSDLQSAGVRCWFAPEDLRIGDRIRISIERSIRVHDKVLLIISDNSVNSDWIEYEIENALEKEEYLGGTVLYPIRLDDEVMLLNKGWAARLRRTRHIGDFTKWKHHDEYKKALSHLLRDLISQRAELQIGD